jgi:hypothetical protein
MVGTSADNANAYPVALVPAGEAINDVDAVPGVEVVDSTLAVDTPDLDETLARDEDGHVIVCGKDGWMLIRHAGADAGQPSPRSAPRARMRTRSGMRLAYMTSAAKISQANTAVYVGKS